MRTVICVTLSCNMSISLQYSKVWSRGRNAPFDIAVAASQFSVAAARALNDP